MTPQSLLAHSPEPAVDYGVALGDTVNHIKGDELPGIVTELDSDHDLGGVTTCRVAWGATSLEEAMATPRADQDIQWTNKLVRVPSRDKAK